MQCNKQHNKGLLTLGALCFIIRCSYEPCVCVCVSGSMTEYDTENMNSEEIYSSLRGVTEAIQSFSYRSQEDLNEPGRQEGKRDDGVSPRVLLPVHSTLDVVYLGLLPSSLISEEKTWHIKHKPGFETLASIIYIIIILFL